MATPTPPRWTWALCCKSLSSATRYPEGRRSPQSPSTARLSRTTWSARPTVARRCSSRRRPSANTRSLSRPRRSRWFKVLQVKRERCLCRSLCYVGSIRFCEKFTEGLRPCNDRCGGCWYTSSPDRGRKYRFGVRRNPRTLAGTTPGGDLLLVALDRRQPGYSVGASFKESAQIMAALGAEEAVNLDGGGSTAMRVDERLVSHQQAGALRRPFSPVVAANMVAQKAIS